MELDLATIADTVASAAWPLGRVTGLVMTAPIFAAATVPMPLSATSFTVMRAFEATERRSKMSCARSSIE